MMQYYFERAGYTFDDDDDDDNDDDINDDENDDGSASYFSTYRIGTTCNNLREKVRYHQICLFRGELASMLVMFQKKSCVSSVNYMNIIRLNFLCMLSFVVCGGT